MPAVVGQSHANLLPAGQPISAATLFRSLSFRRAPNASILTMVILADQDGTLDVEALWFGGAEGVLSDWYVYNRADEQVAVVANQPARVTVWGGAPVMRIRYTPDAPATVSRAEAYYTTHGSNA